MLTVFTSSPVESLPTIGRNALWKENAVTVAGTSTQGQADNQLNNPNDLVIDEDGTIYVSDCTNHRIVAWESGAQKGKIIAGRDGPGNAADQLSQPTALLIDRNNKRLIISEMGNRCISSWFLDDGDGEIIIEDVPSHGLAMDDRGFLYVSDFERDEVRRYAEGEQKSVIVAGGNGRGDSLNQLNQPRQIFVDEEQSIYISDTDNHRVVKWAKDSKEGIVVAGGQGPGNSLSQLNSPRGLLVDTKGSVYVADAKNKRVMRWLKGATEGRAIVKPGRANPKFTHSSPPRVFKFGSSTTSASELSEPDGLFLDDQGNLYVADFGDHRIQRFDIQRFD